jgi:membrane protein
MTKWHEKRWWRVIWGTFQGWNNDDGMTLAAAMAYYAAFSFFPLLLILVAGLGFFLRYWPVKVSSDGNTMLLEALEHATSPALSAQVQELIQSVPQQATIGGPIGVLMLLFGAVGVFAQMDTAFDRIWKVSATQAHGLWWTLVQVLIYRLKAFVMLLALGVLVLASFLVGMGLSAVASSVPDSAWAETGWRWAQHGAIVLVNTLVFTLVFKAIPRTRIWWRHALPGGLLVAIIWEIGRQVLALFVIGTRYSAYGLIGTFIAIMVWVYYASMALFLGGEFVKTLKDTRPDKT